MAQESQNEIPLDNTFTNGNLNITINATTDASTKAPPNNSTEALMKSCSTNMVAAEDKSITSEKLLSEPDQSTPEKTSSGTLQPSLDEASSKNDAESSNISTKTNIEQLIARIIGKEGRDPNIIGGLVGLFLVLYCLPRISWGTVIVGVLGMGFGGFVAAFYLLAVPEATRLQRARTIANFGKRSDQQLEIIDRVPTFSSVTEKDGDNIKGVHLPEIKEVQHQHVSISPDIDPMVEDMINFTLRDFVNVPIGLISEGQHNIPLRASLVTMAMNVSDRLSNMRLPETALLGIFGLQNSFIVHLRAYRELRSSRLPIAQYVSTHANADSVLGRCYHREERIKQFRSIAKAICQALLPKNDQQSEALFAVMQEIMATHVLEATLEHICDPDFVNLSIIDYFSTPDKSDLERPGIDVEANGPLTNKTASAETTPHEAPISTLADSILMNAAHLMDKSVLDNQTSNQGAQTPVPSSAPVPPSAPAPSSTPVRSSTPPKMSAIGETNAPSRPPTVESPRTPPVVTLKNVLENKNDHVDTFQAFMSYLQVWDALDLANFWLMIDVFHRQIEQGTLTDIEALRREAINIYETYCGPDIDHDIAGFKEARGGALLKNLKKNIQREPAICFREPQEWALGVLEIQYWTPFKIKLNNEKPVVKAESLPNSRQSPPGPIGNIASQETLSVEAGPTADHGNLPSSEPMDSANDTNSKATGNLAPPPPRLKARWIQVSDMVNQRPKTLMSNSDLSYMIEVQVDEEQGWMVTRTFQQLEQLHAVLVQQFPVVQRTSFPRWRLQPSDKVCNGLQNFLRAMLSIPEVGDSSSLTWFLSKELDQNPGAVIPGTIQPSNSGSILSFPPLSDSAFGAAAAQGAKTALRQASEASLSAGRFFKSLGSVVNPGSSPQLSTDDRSVRGSFESERSIRSVSSAPTLSDQRNLSGMPLPFGAPRSQEIEFDPHSTTPSLSEINQPNRRLSSMSSSSRVTDGLSSPLTPSPVGNNHPPQQISGQVSSPRSEPSGISPKQSVERLSGAPTMLEAPLSLAQSTSPAQEPTPIPAVIPPTETKKSQMSLLSSDELDLLIETTFTVLEDMMDFSKGQSIRRMTFGMLRELVRKSYRVAINQSFSAWVEQNTSHEYAIETVKWMKDDLLWPNGEWPVASTAPTQSTTTPSSPAEKRDVFQVGEDKYEVGADGIAVKVSTELFQSTTDSTTASTPGVRTLQEKEATREKARELFKMMLPGSLSTVLGKEAVSRGLVDVFEMFQTKELNLGLALSVLEMTVRLIFTR